MPNEPTCPWCGRSRSAPGHEVETDHLRTTVYCWNTEALPAAIPEYENA